LPRSTVIDAPSAHARLWNNRKVEAKAKVKVKMVLRMSINEKTSG
jgi:hypothetical protein